MFRRITMLIPLLLMLTLSGCIFLPGGHGGHRYYDGGPGYYHR
ncbi:hypothetical protein [Pseudomonas sp. CF161]|nr:hypothetical protein [Pseudomonas sp. CF161]